VHRNAIYSLPFASRTGSISSLRNLHSSAVEMLFFFIDLRSSLAFRKSELWKNRPCCSGSVDR
jgi:hypothetical protein